MITYVVKSWEDELHASAVDVDTLPAALALVALLREDGVSCTLWMRIGRSEERCMIDTNESWCAGVVDPRPRKHPRI